MTSRRSLLLTASLIFSASSAFAQTASPVIDLEQDPSAAQSSGPQQYTAVAGGRVVFAAATPGSGREVWTSDGTDVGTRMLVDVCPGDCSSFPEILGSVGGRAVWAASADASPDRLWATDGTAEGTAPLADGGVPLTVFRSLGGGDDPSYLPLHRALLGGAFYFHACGAVHGCGVWRSDGTAAGTRLAVPGSKIGGAFVGDLAAAGGQVFFLTSPPGGAGSALWRTDGTAAGTLLLANFSSSPRALTAAGAKLFFTAPRDSNGEELWVSDGTRLGTKPLTHFNPPAPFTPGPQFDPVLRAAGNHVNFAADDGGHGWELWRSDGTVGGTRRITDFSNPTPFSFYTLGSQLVEVQGRVLFQATDGTTGWKLWMTTGDPASTVALHDCLGSCQTDFAPALGLFGTVGGRALFLAFDAVHGLEPWSTDGTAAGTQFLRDLCPGTCSSTLYSGTAPLPGGLGFVAFPSDTSPAQLWVSDGTPAGTRPLTHFTGDFSVGDAVPLAVAGRIFLSASNADGVEPWVIEGGAARQVSNLAPDAPSSFPSGLVPITGRLIFQAFVDGTTRLYQTDGTATTELLAFFNPPNCEQPCPPVAVPGAAGTWAAYIEEPQSNQNGFQLFRTDGTVAGTLQLTSITRPDVLYLNLAPLASGVVLFFVDRNKRHELWRSDGTVAGTVMVAVVPGTDLNTPPVAFSSTGTEAWFGIMGDDGVGTVWRSDGTAAGTKQVLALQAGTEVVDLPMTRAGSRVFFETADLSSRVVQLWSSDGTAAGTVALTEGPSFGLFEMKEWNGTLYFLAFDAALTGGLWRSDGTPEGTLRLHEFSLVGDDQFSTSVRPSGLTPAGSRIFFAAKSGNTGTELWASDGTAAGTVLVEDINPIGSSNPGNFAAVGNRVYFSASDGTHGTELWTSDGTAAGTRLVQDIAPEEDSSAPDHLTVLGDRLYFSADDGTIGRELWSLPLTGSTGCQASATTLCLGNGRYQVDVTWRDPQDHHGAGMAVPLTGATGDTGAFWFFNADNYELVVKVLDGTGVNGHVWVFYGALSNVEYTLTVTDTQTGLARRYLNPQGNLASVGDIHAFGPLGAKSRNPEPLIAPPSPAPQVATVTDPRTAHAAKIACDPTPTTLCLGSRFAVSVAWKDFQGNTGNGTAIPLTGDTGAFWFFNAQNLELIVKVLDGTPVNGHFWLFYGALSNVEYTVTVTDVQTGTTKRYSNPAGRFASVADTEAF